MSLVSGGQGSSGYQVSSVESPTEQDEGYQDSITLGNDATSFFVKLMSTEHPGDVFITFTISGNKVTNGEVDPDDKSLMASTIEPKVTPTPTPTPTPTETPFVPKDPSKLWIAFSENGHNYPTKYSPFWEVAKSEEEVVRVSFDNEAGVQHVSGQSRSSRLDTSSNRSTI